MVRSGVEGPARPTTQTSLREHRIRRREAWSLRRISSETNDSDGLDWDHFRDLYHPDSRRHNLEAIVAYGEYKRTTGVHGGREAAPLKDAIAAASESLGEWEDEGGALRDRSGGSRE